MASIFHNLRSDKKCRASTGLSLEQFDALADVFCKYYQARNSNPYTKVQPVFTDHKEALFLILHYLKSYPTLENMALYFDVDIRTIVNYLKLTKQALKATLKTQEVFVKRIFKSQSDFDQTFQDTEDLLIDCTEIAVQRPDNEEEQRQYYSGKKKDIP